MTEETHAVIILFGGSGDLARRKLYPAMFGLFRRGQLCQHFAVIGTARRPWSDAYYREIVSAASKTNRAQRLARWRRLPAIFITNPMMSPTRRITRR